MIEQHPHPAPRAPIARIIDRYSQTVTPWVSVERADGSRETISPYADELLAFARGQVEADLEVAAGLFVMAEVE